MNADIAKHVREIEDMRAEISRKAELRKAVNYADRARGHKIKELRVRSNAVVEELFRREIANTLDDWSHRDDRYQPAPTYATASSAVARAKAPSAPVIRSDVR